jgi:hypothetical protein
LGQQESGGRYQIKEGIVLDFNQIVVGAVLVEAVWETGKMTYQSGKFSADRVGSLVIGIGVAVAGGLDACAAVGLPLGIPFLGSILTGVLISRGANFAHDLLGTVQGMRMGVK